MSVDHKRIADAMKVRLENCPEARARRCDAMCADCPNIGLKFATDIVARHSAAFRELEQCMADNRITSLAIGGIRVERGIQQSKDSPPSDDLVVRLRGVEKVAFCTRYDYDSDLGRLCGEAADCIEWHTEQALGDTTDLEKRIVALIGDYENTPSLAQHIIAEVRRG